MTANYRVHVKIGDSELSVEGDREFVETTFEQFVVLSGGAVVGVARRGRRSAEAKATGRKPGRRGLRGAKGKRRGGRTPRITKGIAFEDAAKGHTTRGFLELYNANTHFKRVMAAGYYFQRVRNFNRFSTADIREFYRLAGLKPPTNTSDILSRASRMDAPLIESRKLPGKKREVNWSLTLAGAELVENLRKP